MANCTALLQCGGLPLAPRAPFAVLHYLPMRRAGSFCLSLLLLTGCAAKRPHIAATDLVERASGPSVKSEDADEEEEREREREDNPDAAAEFYVLKRAAPGSPLPVERYAAAQEHALRMPQYSIASRRFIAASGKTLGARSINLGSWQALGPGNVGGRTRALAIHPTDPAIMYAGTVGGGVWKTTDAGNSWKPLSDLLPSIGITTLAMDPQNPDTIYAGTGEWYTGSSRGDSIRGLGIFKTIDAGSTWTQLATTNNASFYYVNKLVVSPSNSKHLYAATYGGVWSSLDAGITWRRTFDRVAPFTGCQDVVIRSDQSSDYVFAACGARQSPLASAIFRNTNAADPLSKWEQVLTAPNMDRTSLALAPSNQSIIYALSATSETGEFQGGLLAVYRSSSNGDADSWEVRASRADENRVNRVLLTNPREANADICSSGTATYSNQGTYDNVIAVDPLNPDIVWAGGIDVFRSDDGGRNWGIAAFWQASAPLLVHSDVHVLTFAPGYNGNDNQTLFAATDGGVYSTSNALAETASGERAACSPYPTKVEWKSLNHGFAATQFYHGAVYPGGAAYAGGSQDNGTNRGSDADGSDSWRRLVSGDGGFFAIDPTDPNLVYGESQGLSFVRSVNGGASLATATRGITEPASNFQFITPFVLDPAEPKRLYIGGRTLWRSTDGAANWTEASATIGTTNGSISSIAVAPSDPDRMVFGTSTGLVYRNSAALSASRTTVWESALPRTGYLSRLTFDPGNADIVYATYSQFKTTASQRHVYKSTDGGASWTGIDGSGDTAIPDIPVFALIVDPQNTNTLYVGSDLGVFVSLDGGNTWARDDNPFANAVTETLVLDRSAGSTTLYAFTHGRGVWRTTIPGSGEACKYAVTPASANVPAFGETLAFKVSTGDGCGWSAYPTSGFTVQSPAGGVGAGTFTVVTGQNANAQPKNGTINVQNTAIAVQQGAALAASGNDERATAFAFGPLPAVVIQNTSNASESADDPVHTCTRSRDSKTAWFRLTAEDTGTLRLSFRSSRLDNGADSGVVLAVYNAAGTETTCSILPQGTQLITTRTLSLPIKAGDALVVEIAATVANAAAGALALPGNLTLAAAIVQP